jgi:peptidoglycan/xylan/chitin deacetylase (PgdA/CDA1 family)
LYQWLRSVESETELRRIVHDLGARYGLKWDAPCRELCMDWAEIGAMAADPLCTVGAHTVNHRILRKWPDAVVREEMKRSADVIEAALGQRPQHFAYPFGNPPTAGPREFEIAREVGFRTAVTTRNGVLFPVHREHLTALPRISLNGHFQELRYVDVLISGAPFALVSGFRRVDAA